MLFNSITNGASRVAGHYIGDKKLKFYAIYVLGVSARRKLRHTRISIYIYIYIRYMLQEYLSGGNFCSTTCPSRGNPHEMIPTQDM